MDRKHTTFPAPPNENTHKREITTPREGNKAYQHCDSYYGQHVDRQTRRQTLIASTTSFLATLLSGFFFKIIKCARTHTYIYE